MQRFEFDIGLRVNTEENAMSLLRANMIERGLDPDAVPDLAPETVAAGIGRDGKGWWESKNSFAGWQDADFEVTA